MSYGDHTGPDMADKGQEGGSCNRGLCQAPDAIWFNHGSLKWYCAECRDAIEFDRVNFASWAVDHYPRCGHPMFETREMMDARRLHKIPAGDEYKAIYIREPEPEPSWPSWSEHFGRDPGRQARLQIAAARVEPTIHTIHTMTRQIRRQLARKGGKA